MYRIEICPLKRLYQIDKELDKSRAAVLAVSSYAIKTELLSGFVSLLTMQFADTTVERSMDAFDLQKAKEIKAFVDALPSRVDTLFVCCDSGESRSTAMAAAILRYLKLDEWVIWKNSHYHPNPLVYSRLCAAFGIRVWKYGLRRRVKCSENAFRNAIKANERKARR